MTLRDARKMFVEYNKTFIQENKNDKIKVNTEYQWYLDSLCKSGLITQKQWQNASFRIVR